jgi:hypothetical protein
MIDYSVPLLQSSNKCQDPLISADEFQSLTL